MQSGDRWLRVGLALTTLATLLLELLDSRLLSVLTWYHLSFMAVSLAMLGMAAGAVLVFLAGDRISESNARRVLGAATWVLALSIPLTHLWLLQARIPLAAQMRPQVLIPLITTVVVLTVPFIVSGIAVTVALTRTGGRIGVLYAFDLLGASLGCLLIVPLLNRLDLMSVAIVTAALAAAGAFCFGRSAAKRPDGVVYGVSAAALTLAAAAHVFAGAPIKVEHPHGQKTLDRPVLAAHSNAHSHVMVLKPRIGRPVFWGRGNAPDDLEVESSMMVIDGSAGTVLTRWNGDPDALSWVQYDITSLPYHLRSGEVAIIGVGGGRDALAAIWARSSSITAIELNGIFLDILSRSHREFAQLADVGELNLVHDEGRAYLTRSTDRFDVLQMSLVDTWAATGAGAFTLSENALYTREAWLVFMNRLKPNGLLSTSRWYDPGNVSETSRLLALGVSTLLDMGVERPSDHIVLATRRKVATMLMSPTAFSAADRKKLREVSERLGFALQVFPGESVAKGRLDEIVNATSHAALDTAVADPDYDFSAPSDDRPYFFNMLRLGSFGRVLANRTGPNAMSGVRGVVWGNIRATWTLMALLSIATILVLVIIFFPLLLTGLPSMSAGSFGLSLSYFALIGAGFMLIQIPFLQRFSVLLGHPIYSFSVILFTMILFAGVGSMLSDRLTLEGRSWHVVVPVAIAALLLAETFALPRLLGVAIELPLVVRCFVVVTTVAPLSTLLGFCFPIGMRLVDRISPDATAWMWGVNGACGVLASILAVVISVWAGISTNLFIAASLYLLLALPAHSLARRALR